MNKTGTIYIIKCKDKSIKDCYVGSTTNLELRKQKHKYDCMDSKLKVYQFIKANGNFDNFEFEILEDNIEFNEKKQLLKIERYYIEEFQSSLNMVIPTRTQKEWIKENKDKVKEYEKLRHKTEKRQEWIKKYREENKDRIKEYDKIKSKEFRENNKERLKEYKKNHYENNKNKISEKSKKWYQENKNELLQKMKIKTKCICGSEITKVHYIRHCKTKKHLQYIENNN